MKFFNEKGVPPSVFLDQTSELSGFWLYEWTHSAEDRHWKLPSQSLFQSSQGWTYGPVLSNRRMLLGWSLSPSSSFESEKIKVCFMQLNIQNYPPIEKIEKTCNDIR